MSEQPPAPPPPPPPPRDGLGGLEMADQQEERQVMYVQAQSNGMATAALVLGLVGAVFGLIPLTFWIALICGILAVVFGISGRRNAAKGLGRGGMATWGLILGIVAIALGILGIAIIFDAFEDLEDDLESIAMWIAMT